MTKFHALKRSLTFFLLGVATAIAASGQTLTTLATFNGTDGYDAQATLAQGYDGNLYGTTELGGDNNLGTIFKTTPGGTLTTLHDFSGSDGGYPSGSLVQGLDGNFYGTTPSSLGGPAGTIFNISPSGAFTTLYKFGSEAGDGPTGGLVLATNGNFYGTTFGGTGSDYGTVFEFSNDHILTTLHTFSDSDGFGPSALIQGSDGSLYGTTFSGGTPSCDGGEGCGTVFKITLAGDFTLLHNFYYRDGATPQWGVIEGSDGNFYGTTEFGGKYNVAECLDGCGTIFKMSRAGAFETIYTFLFDGDGAGPSGLVEGTDGNFYGTTDVANPSKNYWGTVFAVTPSGALTTLYSFTDKSDGGQPLVALLQDTNGAFYGTTTSGGVPGCEGSGCGTVFKLSAKLGPFVRMQPQGANVGREVQILGTDLTGATSVSFNGIPAEFTVRSGSLILATVPNGATTGYVMVGTPNGTLTSNMPFPVGP